MNIHELLDICKDASESELADLEAMFTLGQIFYIKCCDMTGQKSMKSRTWQRKVAKWAKKDYAHKKGSLNDLWVATSLLCVAENGSKKEAFKGIEAMYHKTIRKIVK